MSIARALLYIAIAAGVFAPFGSARAAGAPAKGAGFVVVQFPLASEREHRVVWQRGLTVERAIVEAAGKETSWNVAWRWRSTFWTRHSLNPHSLVARIVAGEGATGYRRFSRREAEQRKARLRPGDCIVVDLPPIS